MALCSYFLTEVLFQLGPSRITVAVQSLLFDEKVFLPLLMSIQAPTGAVQKAVGRVFQ